MPFLYGIYFNTIHTNSMYKEDSMKKTIDKRVTTSYLLGMLGQNMIYAVMSTGVMFYFQSVIFLPAMAISVITILSKIIEFISDPVMGFIIDNTNSKFGKCRPYLLFTPLPICICSILVFINHQYSSDNSTEKNVFIILWAGISSILFGLVYSAGDVSLWAFPSLIHKNGDKRNKLLADAKIVSTIGGSLIVLIVLQLSQYMGNIITQRVNNSADGLQIGTISVCSAIILIGSILFQITGLTIKERNTYSKNKISLKQSFSTMWNCKPFRKIMISGILRSPYMLINTVQNVLYIYYFGNNGQIPYITYMIVIGGFSMIGQLFAGFAAPKLTKKCTINKLNVIFNITSSVMLIGIFILYLSNPHHLSDTLPFIILTILFFLFSFSLGIVFTLQSFMIADAVDYEEKRNGYRPDGIFFSGQSLLVKISTGISALISGVIYTAIGFSGDTIEKINTQLYSGASFACDSDYSKYRFALFLMLSVIPAIGFLLSIFPFKEKRCL